MRYIFLFCVHFLAVSAVADNHNPILPKPQKVIYGKAQLPLRGLTIVLASVPSPEDRFSALELQKILSKITGTTINIMDSKITGPSIIFERTGNVDPLPKPGEKTGSASREAYAIKVTAREVKISARSSAGLFYGVQTLRQLIEGNGHEAFLPEVEIEDWPSLAYRGFMMDMSHVQLPKVEEIKQQIDFISHWKGNQYYFYSEASIELEGYPLLMADARYSKAQVKEVIEYAKARYVDVIPNMELYGHLHDLFRLEHYADLAVVPHGGEFRPNDPRVKPILEDWVRQIAQLFPSSFFHIGFDETWLIEQEAKKLNKAPDELYLQMLQQTTDLVNQQGKHPLVWADMLQKYPTIIPKISKNTIAVPWHYFPKEEKEYDIALNPFANANVDMILQSAIINWNWLVPAFDISFKNTDLLVKAGKKYKAIGFINSGWTDDTQTIMRMGFPAIAYGFVAAWQSESVDRKHFFHHYTHALYPHALAEKATQAYTLLMTADSLIRNAFPSTDPAFWADPFTAENLKLAETHKADLHNSRLASEDAQIYIREALKYNTDTTTLFALFVGAKMLDYLSLKYLYAAEINELWKQASENPDKKAMGTLYFEVTFKYHTRTSDMLDAMIDVKEVFKKAWLNEYTPFRLGVALGKYDEEFQYWLRLQRKLENSRMNHKENDTLPSLESILKQE